jgi:phage FluMu gp28-like protein
MAVMALHAAFVKREQRVLILSAGDDAAKDLLGEASALCQSPLLAGSVADASRSQITLSNGSTIRSVPASPRRVRGQAIDLLILDEACFIDEEIWTAARYTIIARPGSRVVMASTPWGAADRFFAVHYRAGERGEDGTASFHWPSTVSPLVDQELLVMWQRTATDREYRREVLAEWVDDAGAYFTTAELSDALEDYDLVLPADAGGRDAVGGVDWGFRRTRTRWWW